MILAGEEEVMIIIMAMCLAGSHHIKAGEVVQVMVIAIHRREACIGISLIQNPTKKVRSAFHVCIV